jgi:hypothetical protein
MLYYDKVDSWPFWKKDIEIRNNGKEKQSSRLFYINVIGRLECITLWWCKNRRLTFDTILLIYYEDQLHSTFEYLSPHYYSHVYVTRGSRSSLYKGHCIRFIPFHFLEFLLTYFTNMPKYDLNGDPMKVSFDYLLYKIY